MRRATALALAALAAVAAGCTRGGASDTRITSDTLTIYAGLPLRGERAADGRAVLRGMKLALDEAGGRAGELDIGLIALDDTRTATGRWDPRQVAANARIAAENPSTVAYVGELDAGATAVSLPLTNEIGILQVTPLGGASALDAPELSPSGVRTLGTLGAGPAQEADALARWVRASGARTVALAQDGGLDGLGRGTELERALQAAGLDVAEVVRVGPEARPPGSEARAVVGARTDAVVFAGAAAEAAAAFLRAVGAAAPRMQLYATSGVAPGALARALPARTVVRATTLLGGAPRTPAARAVAARYEARFAEPAPALALRGHAALRSILDAVEAAGAQGNDRRAVLRAWRAGDRGAEVLGPPRVRGLLLRAGRARAVPLAG